MDADLRAAAQVILDRCLDFFGDDDLDPDSSEAMPVVIKNRWVYDLRAALAAPAVTETDRRDPLSPPWEDCKVCGGDHWTKDHPAVTETDPIDAYVASPEAVEQLARSLQVAMTDTGRSVDYSPLANDLLTALRKIRADD